jgi:dimethylargininase
MIDKDSPDAPWPRRAVVRPPGASFAAALTTVRPRPTINVELAQEQHRAYVAALQAVGLEVQTLPADERYPDGCFVQDLAVVYEDLAVICRPGALTRRGEEQAVEDVLRGPMRIARVEAPGTLEGGDVLRVGQRFFVGLSERTNRAGLEQLRELIGPLGASVIPVMVEDGLHLMSCCSYVGHGQLLACGTCASLPQFLGLDVIIVPQEEAHSANCVSIGDQVILPEGSPVVRQALELRGFKVHTVPMSEFAKADGGVTCLSLLW